MNNFNPLEKKLLENKDTWLGGPSYMLQYQHIPGYTGHIHGLVSENLHSQPFSKLSSKSIHNRIDSENKEVYDKYLTNYNEQISKTKVKNENLIEKVEIDPKQEYINKEIEPIDRMPVSGYMGYKSVYRNPLKKYENFVKEKKENMEKEKYTKKIINEDKVQVPVVGYSGFISGKKAQNIHGVNFNKMVKNNKIESINSKLN